MLAQTIESGLCTISNCVAQHSLMFFNILAFLSTVRHMTKIVQQFFSCFYIVILKLVFTGTLCHNKMATVRRILSASFTARRCTGEWEGEGSRVIRLVYFVQEVR